MDVYPHHKLFCFVEYCREPSDCTWVVGQAEFSGVPRTWGMSLNYILCCLGAYGLVGDITYTTYTDTKVCLLKCFELSVIRSINGVTRAWEKGPMMMFYGGSGKFVILYVMRLYGDFGENPREPGVSQQGLISSLCNPPSV